MPLSVSFVLAVFISGLASDDPHMLHFEFYGPHGPISVGGQHRHSVQIERLQTEFFEFFVNVNEFPLNAFGAYRVEFRFDNDPKVVRVGRFEVSQGTRLPAGLASQALH